jgi:1-acyl-sn-glycerol-3-phosphate acyltransferase
MATQGNYETATDAAHPVLKRCPTFAYYTLFFRAAFRARLRLARGDEPHQTWIAFCVEVLRAFERVGVKLQLSGYAPGEIPDGPFVAVANHMSLIDSMIAAAILCPVRPASGVVAERLVNTPLIGPIVRASRAVTVSGRSPRRDLTMLYAAVVPRIQQGETFIVFPEGQRGPGLNVSRFNSLGVKLARAADVPLVPVALKTDAWGIGLRALYLAPVRPGRPMRLQVLPPLSMTTPDQPVRAAQMHVIAEQVTAWGAVVQPHPRPPFWLHDPLTGGRPPRFVRASAHPFPAP